MFPKHQLLIAFEFGIQHGKDKGNMHLNQFNDFTIWDFTYTHTHRMFMCSMCDFVFNGPIKV